MTIIADATNATQTQTFGYDWLDRLTSAATNAVGVGQYSHTYAYNAIGNITSYNGNTYSYGTKPHAVTAAFGNSYGYDAVGNQTGRTVGGVAYTQTFDYDNRLTSVAGGSVSAAFLYDAEGNRVKGAVAGVTTVYVAGLYEYQNGAVTKYYEGGAMRRTGYASDNGVFYIVSDHLRSTSVLVNRDGTVKSRNFYYPYGGNRGGSAFSGVTTKRFTGQYHEQGLPGGEGLSYYNARWYDAQVGMFISADTLVPSPLAPQTFNRYAYVGGNPLNHTDTSGHDCDDGPQTYAACYGSKPASSGVIRAASTPSSRYAVTYTTPIVRLIRSIARSQAAPRSSMQQVLKATTGAGLAPGLPWLDRLGGMMLHANFGGLGASRGDVGFASEFQDDHLYGDLWGIQTLPESRQLGHFLTAVNMGMQNQSGLIASIVSHEQSSDRFFQRGGPLGGPLFQMARGATQAGITNFNAAMTLDAQGDYYGRDRELGAIYLESGRVIGDPTVRRGNSMEDLRLSVRGYRLGQMLVTGDPPMSTNWGLANWLITNIVEGGY